MDAAELEKYEYQLSQIKLALAKDPTNVEYLNLKEELSSLIDITKEYLASTSTSTSTSTTANSSAPAPPSGNSNTQAAKVKAVPQTPVQTVQHSLKSGDLCQARYSGDSKFYPARITSVGGSDENRVYSVIFEGYDSTEIVSYSDLKPVNDRKRALQLTEDELEKERKRKKNEKKADTKQVKTLEQGIKQKSWQSFAKKGTKKGVVIPGISGGSMFRSPEDGQPTAKVGVVGSGKGMTKTVERKRQTFS